MRLIQVTALLLLTISMSMAQCFQMHADATQAYTVPGTEYDFLMTVETLGGDADSLNINIIKDVPDDWSASVCTEGGCLMSWITFTQIWVEPGVLDTVTVDFFTSTTPAQGTITLEMWLNGCPEDVQSITFYAQTFGEGVAAVSPETFHVLDAYPNPFNPETCFSWTMVRAGAVSLIVHDLRGKEIADLLDSQPMNAGEHTYLWNASSLPSGVYVVAMKLNGKQITRRVTLLK